MKKRIEIKDREKHINLSPDDTSKDDFYDRWYAKFGKPQTITLRGDEFMKRLKEMIEFE